jgi:hypothetical protein
MITGFNTNFKSDFSLGMNGEESVLPKLRSFFQKDIRKESAKYSKWDYIDEDGTLYELKTRRCMSITYPTTMLPVHKVVDGAEQYFIFNFTDKIMYLKYDKNLFASFEVSGVVDGRYAYKREAVSHFYIPLASLSVLSS